MRLKQIVIFGFKSFADKTTVTFHEGITVIVGPNGCGKSNIGDAIQWVLGEQSVKALRGGKMPDVIFAGTTTRKPLQFAEVTIVFDQIEGELNIPYVELAITRRIERNGDSAYLINKQPVRLKDIQSLFFDSGIGKRNFSTFQQKEIDAIIQQAPKERRVVFEEAAAINRFLHTRKESLRRFDEVDLNLKRLEDVYREVKKQVDLLERQSVEAVRYKEAQERVEVLEKGLLKMRHDGYKKRHQELKAKEAVESAVIEKEASQRELLAKECERLRASYEGLEQSHSTAREEYAAQKGARELSSHKRSVAEKRTLELTHEIEERSGELKQLQNERFLRVQEIEKLEAEVKVREAESSKAEIEKNALFAKLQAFDKELSQLRLKHSSLQQLRLEALREEARFDGECGRQMIRIENNREKRAHFDERLKGLDALLKEKEKELLAKRERSIEALAEIQEAKAALKNAEQALQKKQAECQEAEKRRNELHREWVHLQARKNALVQLQQEGAGLSEGSKKLLQASHQKTSPVFGLLTPLYEWIETEGKDPLKLQMVLKKYSETLVVESESDLLIVLEEINRLKIQEYSLLCLSDIAARDKPSVTAHFWDVSKGVEVWCEGGYLLDHRKVRFFGSVEKSSVFSREEEIRSLEVKVLEIQKLEEECAIRAVELDAASAAYREQLKNCDQEHRKREMRGVDFNFQLQKAEQEFARIALEKRQTEEESHILEQQVASAIQALEALKVSHAEAKARSESALKESAQLEESTSAQSLHYEEFKASLSSASKLFEEKDSLFRKCSHTLGLLKVKEEEAARLLEKISQALEKASLARSALQRELEISFSNDESEEKLEAAKRLVEEKLEASKKAKEVWEARKKLLQASEDAFRQAEAKLNQVEIQLAHVETGLSALERELTDRFGGGYSELEPLNMPVDQAEKEVKKHKQYLESCPQVNLAAIGQCALEKEREETLRDQIEDLVHSKDELNSLIKNVESDCRAAFLETFQTIRGHFQKNFAILFRGGEADLELAAGEDPLEAGIEISAKPPGKQMRSLSLLSGGEKCLTAMALLFAIFEVKSSPFCLLDEIDAPLDDANVERFVAMVREYTDRSQFIIVTHNKRTMAMADRLYGVSMQEKGVSKLLSMEFIEDLEPALEIS